VSFTRKRFTIELSMPGNTGRGRKNYNYSPETMLYAGGPATTQIEVSARWISACGLQVGIFDK